MEVDGGGVVRLPLEITVVILLSTLAIVGFINPLPELIMRVASVAQPEEETAVSLLALPASEWCLAGDFQDWNFSSHVMEPVDEGVYETAYMFAEPGRYTWNVVSCGDGSHTFPRDNSWVYVTQPNQIISFSFNVNIKGDDFYPFRFAVHAGDEITSFTAVGGFQDWVNDNPASQLRSIGDGLYRLIYQIPEPDAYTGSIVVTGTWDGFMADGRSSSWNEFQFQTTRPDQYVIFLLDTNTDRSSIRYGIHPMLVWLAFDGGMRLLAILLGGVALAIWSNMMWNWLLYAPHRWVGAGCPQCGQHSLKRIPRQGRDRVLGRLGVPVKRFLCTTCRWEGQRIDDSNG